MSKESILKKHQELSSGIVTLVDVGASGGIDKRWKMIGQNIRVIGFEPDMREFEKLTVDDHFIWVNKALYSDNDNHELFITKWQTNTSFLRPNVKIIRDLYIEDSNFDILKTVSVPCEKLDDLVIREDLTIDVLKLDTQGTELYILQGAEKNLKNNLFAVESEVEFVELYEGQPLFADIDRFLRAKGYMLMDYGNMTFLKGRHSLGLGGPKGLLVAADALYFKSIKQLSDILEENGKSKFFSIIMICLAYGYSDYAVEICVEAKRLNLFPKEYLDAFINRLEKVGHYAQFIPNFFGKKKIAMALRAVASLLSKTEDVSKINSLGNQVELFRW